jgi:4-hydroxythreonine-4-phosphate dehydrogenase
VSGEASGPGLLALTQGEPAGIGPDIAIDAWLARESARLPPLLYLGPVELLERRAAAMGRRVALAEVGIEEAA